MLPNGKVLTTTAGKLKVFYNGYGGAVTYYVPKTSAVNEINDPVEGVSLLQGSLYSNATTTIGLNESRSITAINFPFVNEVDAYNCLLLTDVNCPLATDVYFDSSSLTAKSIGDFLNDAKTNNADATGAANFAGGLNAKKAQIATYMGLADGAALDTWVSTNLPDWAISFNP